MNVRSLILSGVAAAAIAGGTAFAQGYSGDYARYGGGPPTSTPQEMQQTDELNQQAVDGTTESPAVLNGEEPNQNAPVGDYNQSQYTAAPAQYQNQSDEGGYYPPGNYQRSEAQYNAPPGDDPPPYTSAQTQYTEPPNQYPNAAEGNVPPQSGAQDQYQMQRQQYEDQLQQYQNAQQHYRYDRSRYARDLRAYDLAQYEWSYPAPIAYHYGDYYGLRPLYLIAEPSTQLWRAPVEGPDGRWVGRVRNVDIAPDGRPLRVEVALNRRVSVWVQPGDLRYDPADHVLFTDLTRGDLWTMPGATVETAPL